MSIRDLLEQGIRIQGAYQIKQYDDAFETYDILIEGDEFEEMNQVDCKDVLDMEITYMYTIPKAFECCKMVIEVK